jgi:hypothetical protein
MDADRTVGEIVASLEAQVAFHRERLAFHAEQEGKHREQRAEHEARLAEVSQHLAQFRAVATGAAEIAGRLGPAPRPLEIELGARPRLPRLIGRILRELAPEEPFGAARMTAEINRRFGPLLRKPATARLVSIALRRLAERGAIHPLRSGRPHREALYTRDRRQEPAEAPAAPASG